MRITVATYNVHRCIGRDRRHDPERILAVLRELDADVVALQELEWNPDDALHLVEQFARELGCVGVAGPTLLNGSGHYGNCVLSRRPVGEVRRIDLSVDRREPRGALDLDLEADGKPILRVVATHLGLWPYERRNQMRRILGHLGGGSRRPPAPDESGRTPAVLLGDLNEWFTWGRPLRWLHAHFGHSPGPATFPAHRPLFALDRIWVEPRSLCSGVRAHATALAREASDHLPLRAVLQWTASAGEPACQAGTGRAAG